MRSFMARVMSEASRYPTSFPLCSKRMVVVVETFGAVPERDREVYPPLFTPEIDRVMLFAGFVPPNILPAKTKDSLRLYPLPAYAFATAAAEYIFPVSVPAVNVEVYVADPM